MRERAHLVLCHLMGNLQKMSLAKVKSSLENGNILVQKLSSKLSSTSYFSVLDKDDPKKEDDHKNEEDPKN